MPFEFFRPLLLSFLKRPFRSRKTPQPARYRKQNSKFEGKRAPEKSTCGSCEERQTKPRVKKPCNRCRRGQARLPYYLDKGLFPSWGNRAGRPLLRNAAPRLDKRDHPVRDALAPTRASQTFPREGSPAPRRGTTFLARANGPGRRDESHAECSDARKHRDDAAFRNHHSTSTFNIWRTDTMPATCMATAMHRSAIPAKLEKKGPRKSSLTSENRATRTIGITLTMRAESFA